MANGAKLVWYPVDTSDLRGDAKKAHDAYRAAQQKANDARKAFEAEARKALADKGIIPDGMAPVFGYKWGKVSVAFVDAADVMEKTTKTIKL